MPVSINVNGAIAPLFRPEARPTITVAGETSSIPADNIGPIPLRPEPSTEAPLISVDDGELSSPAADNEANQQAVRNIEANELTENPDVDNDGLRLDSLTSERNEVSSRQDNLKEENASIEQEIRNLEQVERQLDRRIAQLKQAQNVGSQINLIV